MTRRRRLPALLLLGLALTACGAAAGPGDDAAPSGTPSGPTGEITVLAAASLKETFTTIASQFEAANPGTTVVLSFGPSSSLATQVVEGAPADVFASASTTTMQTVTDAGAATDPTVFAVNSMAIATPTDPTVPVTSLQDLAKPGVKVAVCATDVPCGVAADTLFADNEVAVTPVTREVDVKAVLSKVTLGEVDAGIVYATDVRAAGDTVVGVPIPADQNVTTSYPIAALGSSSNAALADAFVAYVLSADGQKVLADAGFAAP